MRRPLFALALTLLAIPAHAQGTIALTIDATAVGKNRITAHLTIPAKPGPLTLTYPRWIPGNHAPNAPLANTAKLQTSANGKPIPWKRDRYDPYLFEVTVPAGARTVEASLEYAPRAASADEVFYGATFSETIGVVNWNALLLHPKDAIVQKQSVGARLLLPEGWSAATALKATKTEPGIVTYAPVSLETLIDSPVMLGAHYRTIELATAGEKPHTLHIFSETPETAVPEPFVGRMRRLVTESGKLFGTRPYATFQYLLAVTDKIARSGLEHRASTLNVLPASALLDSPATGPYDAGRAWTDNLIAHEFVHSWNGKYRRPYGLVTATSNARLSTDLLYVYEGLTEYLGEVLMVRSGFRPAERWRDDMRQRILFLRQGAGRDWQPLSDAAVTAAWVYTTGNGTGLRPTNDIYYESALVWLEADAILRRESGGRRSLDDFCRRFFAAPNPDAPVLGYRRTDLVAALRATWPYDWDGFLARRFEAPPSGLPVFGLEASGWRLGFTDQVPDLQVAEAQSDLRWSLGIQVSAQGAIATVVPESPADRAGLTVGSQVLGVDGALFAPAQLRDAIRASKPAPRAIELLVSARGRYRVVAVSLEGGERYPILERIPDQPDRLAEIGRPLVPPTTPL
jgi:predicted metalloprotease with PDZ domain